MPEMRIYPELCKGVEECRLCIEVCPQKLFSPSESLNRKGYRLPQVIQIESCTQCQNCMIYCPDLAISARPDRQGYQINYDYCKGCCICVEECPRGAISLEGKK